MLVGWFKPFHKPPPLIRFQFGSMFPTISITFPNQQSDSHTHLWWWLVSCVEVRNFSLLSFSFLFLSFFLSFFFFLFFFYSAVTFHIYNRVQHYECLTKEAENLCRYSNISHLPPPCDGQLLFKLFMHLGLWPFCEQLFRHTFDL